MSSKEKNSAAVDDNLDVLTTCSICNETYTDPIMLPCLHTFCLTCLKLIGTHTGKNSGDQLPCPLCREKFTIPFYGFAALKKNFWMVQLIEITTTQRGACAGRSDQHEHETLSLLMYCEDCHKVLCLGCISECHQSHQTLDLVTAVENLRSRLQRKASVSKLCTSYGLKKKEEILKQKLAFVQEIQELKTEVEQARSDLKARIDLQADMLLKDLNLHEKKRIEAFDNQEKELDRHLDCLRNVGIYCTDVASSTDGNAGLFCKMASELSEQINGLELMNEAIVDRELCSLEIYFKKTAPTLSEVDKMINIVGEVKAYTDYYSGRPSLVMTIEMDNADGNEGNGIRGMAVVNNEIFIVYERSPVVSIYDMHTQKRRAQMTLEKSVIRMQMGLRRCLSFDGNVYIVNGLGNEILQIDRNQDIKRWSTENGWSVLSISPESTIIATCHYKNTLQEYSLQGTLLHETKLYPAIFNILHAIKLSNGYFVVSHHGHMYADHQVSLVTDAGAITKSFSVSQLSSIRQLFYDPAAFLAVDKDENILVLDRSKSRVLLLSRDLEFRRELLSKEDGLQKPVAMYLDEKNSRIYIADNLEGEDLWKDGRVLVFDINK